MTRRSPSAFALLFVALVACEKASDGAGEGASGGRAALGGQSGQTGANAGSASGAGVGGAGAGTAEQGGAAGSRGGAATGGAATGGVGGGAGDASAGRLSTGGNSGAAGSGGRSGSTGQSGSGTLGGRGGHGGEVASGGTSELAGAGGDAGEPGAGCVDPFETADVSKLVTSEAFDPYAVTGNTASQIRQSINQNRGMDYDAYTSWYVSWQFGDCAGNGLVVTVDVTYEYPEWKPSAGASADLVASWDTYTQALFCHEYGHTVHALDCANDVYTALSQIDAGGDCGAQQSQADAAFNGLLDKYNQLDVQYDADTNHGATMGAVFPPP